MKMNNHGITNRGMSDIAHADIMKSETICDSSYTHPNGKITAAMFAGKYISWHAQPSAHGGDGVQTN